MPCAIEFRLDVASSGAGACAVRRSPPFPPQTGFSGKLPQASCRRTRIRPVPSRDRSSFRVGPASTLHRSRGRPFLDGKTFVSDQFDNALNLAGELRRKISFERPAVSLKPPWWESWRSGSDQAWWIVDAIDEGERRGDCQIEILDLLEGAR